ncbi:MAG: DUF5667 domain-containing protein [Jatrophihabitantaceae bacterium]
MPEHRVPILRGAPRRYPDPATSPNPRVRELVGALAGLPVAPAPRVHFRAELRAQLVAVAPRLIAEGPVEPPTRRPAPERATAASPDKRPDPSRRHLRLGRPIAVVASALVVLLVLLGGAVWMSRRALPGDELYALKRASESVQYALTSGDTARSKELLGFATTRAEEVSALLGQSTAASGGDGPQAGGGISSQTAGLVTSTLASADDDVRRAAQLIGGDAVRSHTAAPLAVMTTWAPGQLARLQEIAARIPAGGLHQRATTSLRLVEQAAARARALAGQAGCGCLDPARSDPLGPLPCTTCSPTRSPHGGTAPGSTGGRTGSVPSTARTPGSTSERTGPGQTGRSGSASGGSGGQPLPSLTPLPSLPSLPTIPPLPSLSVPTSPPVGTGSCGVSVSVGPVGAGLGTCGVHVHI